MSNSSSGISDEMSTTSSPHHHDETSLELKKRSRASFEDVSVDHNEDETIDDDENEDSHHRGKSESQSDTPSPKRIKLEATTTDDNTTMEEPATLSEEQLPQTEDKHRTPDPSKVLFLRNLPQGCEESELMALTKDYNVQDIVVLKAHRQAFVEFDSVESATKFLAASNGVMNVRYRQVYAMYSDRQDIRQSSKEEKPNFVLLATLSNVMYPITVDVLHQVFSRYGDVNKIVVFSKNNNTQGLIQFADVQSATTAKAALDGQNIYTNCCKLRIVYSKMTDLNVKCNNDRTRDYTNPNLPTEPEYMPQRGPAPMYLPYPPYGYPMPGPYGRPMQMDTPVVYVSNIDARVNCNHLFILFGVYGDVERVKILPPPKSAALVEFTNPFGANNALHFLATRSVPLFGSLISVSRSNHYNIATPRAQTNEGQFQDYHNSPLHRFRKSSSKNFNHICPPCKTLHLSNIVGTTTEEEIKKFFERYGPVTVIKFFGEKPIRSAEPKDTTVKMALVQLESLDKAIESLVELHNQTVNDFQVKITFSERRAERRDNGSYSGGGGGGGDSYPPRRGGAPPYRGGPPGDRRNTTPRKPR